MIKGKKAENLSNLRDTQQKPKRSLLSALLRLDECSVPWQATSFHTTRPGEVLQAERCQELTGRADRDGGSLAPDKAAAPLLQALFHAESHYLPQGEIRLSETAEGSWL